MKGKKGKKEKKRKKSSSSSSRSESGRATKDKKAANKAIKELEKERAEHSDERTRLGSSGSKSSNVISREPMSIVSCSRAPLSSGLRKKDVDERFVNTRPSAAWTTVACVLSFSGASHADGK